MATRATITTNATCGERGTETYCRLVEHVRRIPKQNIQCGICDSRSPYSGERHPITNAIDGSNSWWQSPTLNNGADYNWVTVTLDLGQVSLLEFPRCLVFPAISNLCQKPSFCGSRWLLRKEAIFVREFSVHLGETPPTRSFFHLLPRPCLLAVCRSELVSQQRD